MSNDEQMKNLRDGYNDHDDRIAKLELGLNEHRRIDNQRWADYIEFKNRQVDENRKVFRHLDELEKLVDVDKIRACILDGAQTHLTILKIQAKVKELEESSKFNMSKEVQEVINTIMSSVKELEARLDNHHECILSLKRSIDDFEWGKKAEEAEKEGYIGSLDLNPAKSTPLKTEGMTFGEAVEAMGMGFKVNKASHKLINPLSFEMISDNGIILFWKHLTARDWMIV